MIENELSGPWKPDMYEEHLPEELAFDEGLIHFVTEAYQPQNALDLGCGMGYFVHYLRQRGVDAWGVEGFDLGEQFKAAGYLLSHDLTHPLDLQKTYDLVVCMEVIEHIPHDFEDVVFDNIVRHVGKYLLFSGATPGQGGTGHINERPESHWFAQLSCRGLTLRHQDSVEARLSSKLTWYANNVSLWELTSSPNYIEMIAQRDSNILESKISLHRLQTQFDQTREDLQEKLQQTHNELEQSQDKVHKIWNELLEAKELIGKIWSELQEAKELTGKVWDELLESRAQLEQSRVEYNQALTALEHSQQHLQQLQAELQQSHTIIHQKDIKLQEKQAKLKKLRTSLKNHRMEVQQMRSQIEAMESSKFWKLREVWLKFRT